MAAVVEHLPEPEVALAGCPLVDLHSAEVVPVLHPAVGWLAVAAEPERDFAVVGAAAVEQGLLPVSELVVVAARLPCRYSVWPLYRQ